MHIGQLAGVLKTPVSWHWILRSGVMYQSLLNTIVSGQPYLTSVPMAKAGLTPKIYQSLAVGWGVDLAKR